MDDEEEMDRWMDVFLYTYTYPRVIYSVTFLPASVSSSAFFETVPPFLLLSLTLEIYHTPLRFPKSLSHVA